MNGTGMEPAVVGFDTSNYRTSAAAVTLEGEILVNYRELLPVSSGERGLRQSEAVFASKIIPVSYYTQVASKVTFNAIITIGAVVVTTITSLFLSNLSPSVILLIGLIVSILSFGHICHSFDMDLQHPVLDWYDNSEISTIGKSATKSIIWGLVLAIILFLLTVFLPNIGIYLALIFSILYCLARVYMLYIKIKHYYNIMEV